MPEIRLSSRFVSFPNPSRILVRHANKIKSRLQPCHHFRKGKKKGKEKTRKSPKPSSARSPVHVECCRHDQGPRWKCGRKRISPGKNPRRRNNRRTSVLGGRQVQGDHDLLSGHGEG